MVCCTHCNGWLSQQIWSHLMSSVGYSHMVCYTHCNGWLSQQIWSHLMIQSGFSQGTGNPYLVTTDGMWTGVRFPGDESSDQMPFSISWHFQYEKSANDSHLKTEPVRASLGPICYRVGGFYTDENYSHVNPGCF